MKQKPWNIYQYWQKEDEIRKIVDGREKSIDPEILPLITLLNLYGLQTLASCYDHTEEKLPWIDFYESDKETINDLLNKTFIKNIPFEVKEKIYDNVNYNIQHINKLFIIC